MTGVKSVRVRAAAKVNFGLRIVGRRADGYHEIESLFVPLDLADEIEIAIGPAERASVHLRVGEGTFLIHGGECIGGDGSLPFKACMEGQEFIDWTGSLSPRHQLLPFRLTEHGKLVQGAVRCSNDTP